MRANEASLYAARGERFSVARRGGVEGGRTEILSEADTRAGGEWLVRARLASGEVGGGGGTNGEDERVGFEVL